MNPIKLNELARIAQELDALCGDDDALFSDMIEGETDAFEIVARLHNERASALELVAGIKAREADLKARRQRVETRAESIKSSIGKVLRAVGLPKVELPEATYSVRDGKPKLVVVDEKAVPVEYHRHKLEVDKVAINEMFADAAELPNWLVREAATDVVTARTK